MSDHATLVARAEEVFPAARIIAAQDYTDFRRDLFDLYKQEWGHMPPVDRLHEGLRNACRGMAATGHPWWGQVMAEIEAALERSTNP